MSSNKKPAGFCEAWFLVEALRKESHVFPPAEEVTFSHSNLTDSKNDMNGKSGPLKHKNFEMNSPSLQIIANWPLVNSLLSSSFLPVSKVNSASQAVKAGAKVGSLKAWHPTNSAHLYHKNGFTFSESLMT